MFISTLSLAGSTGLDNGLGAMGHVLPLRSFCWSPCFGCFGLRRSFFLSLSLPCEMARDGVRSAACRNGRRALEARDLRHIGAVTQAPHASRVRQSRNLLFPPEFAGRGSHLSLDACGVFDFLRKRARTRHDHGSQAQLFAGAGQGQQGGQGFARAASAAVRQGARRTTSRAGAGDGVQSVLTASVCVHPLTFFSGLFARRLAGTPEEGLRFGAARSHESLRLGGRSRGSWYAFRLLRSARLWCLPIS